MDKKSQSERLIKAHKRKEFGFKKGHKVNEGRKHTDKTRLNISKSHLEIHKIKEYGFKRNHIKFTDKGDFKKGHKGYWTGRKRDNSWLKDYQFKKGEHSSIFTEFKKGDLNLIKKNKERRAKQIFPVKDTSIEVKIQNFLKELKIEFFTHQYIKIEHGYQCDILIPSMNLVIECDGDYWHKYPIGNDIDHIRTSELLSKGFKVLRLWEFEIKKMELNDFKEKLNEDR